MKFVKFKRFRQQKKFFKNREQKMFDKNLNDVKKLKRLKFLKTLNQIEIVLIAFSFLNDFFNSNAFSRFFFRIF